jgi:hypothetical protein
MDRPFQECSFVFWLVIFDDSTFALGGVRTIASLAEGKRFLLHPGNEFRRVATDATLAAHFPRISDMGPASRKNCRFTGSNRNSPKPAGFNPGLKPSAT